MRAYLTHCFKVRKGQLDKIVSEFETLNENYKNVLNLRNNEKQEAIRDVSNERTTSFSHFIESTAVVAYARTINY